MEKRVRMISISKIISRQEEGNRLDMDEIKSLAKSIKQYGLMQPISVYRVQPRKDVFHVIFGNRRLEACKLLNWDEIPVIIDQDNKRIEERNMIENVYRKDFTVFEVARVIEKFLNSTFIDEETGKEVKYSSSDIAVLIGKSNSYVSFYTTYINMEDDFKNLVKEKDINDINIIYELAKTYKKEKLKGSGESFINIVKSQDYINRDSISKINDKVNNINKKNDTKNDKKLSTVSPKIKGLKSVGIKIEFNVDDEIIDFSDTLELTAAELKKITKEFKSIISKFKK